MEIDRPSLLDAAAARAVPEFFGMATLLMASYLAVMIVWPASRSHEFAPLINLTLDTALAAAGWKWRALHTRRYLAFYWLFLGTCAYVGILQTHVSVDSMLTGSAVICTVMAAQLLQPTAAKVCWAVLAAALLGLYAAQHGGLVRVDSAQPLQGVVMGLALLFLGILQARFFNRAGQAASERLLQTEAQRRSEAERASQAKSEFLSVMSHEIRTPLNGIVGLVSLVQDDRLDESTRREYLRMLTQSSQALSSMVSGVLDFSKIEAGQIELVPEPFSLRDWALDLENSFSASAAVKGLFLQIELDAGTGEGVLGDAARLRQIAANYISNAIKFTKAGSIRMRISRPRGDDLLRLEVRDSGIGLTESALQRLFKPYQQADSRTSIEYGGTGLGLSICERLARLMNGSVGVNSRPGLGSTFWAEVQAPSVALAAGSAAPWQTPLSEVAKGPLAGSTAGPTMGAAGSPQGHTASGRPASPAGNTIDLDAGRVLVVDDNAVNRTITSQMLRRMKAVVVTASDGQEGLDLMRLAVSEAWPFDAVLMDVQMPRLDGLSAVRLIRQDPALALTPVVALTAGVLKEDVARAIDAGMDGFLAKPVTADQLGRTVQHFVEAGRQRRAAGECTRF